MVFWLSVLVGGLFAWIAVQIGFYATWIMLFNLVLSAYVAIFLSPVLVATIPAATETPYGYALILLCTASATLLIGYGTCYALLSGRLRAEFPRLFNNVGGGLMGFLSGFLIFSFLSFAVCLTPLADIDTFKSLGFEARSVTTSTSYVCWWCDRLHSFAATSETRMTSEQAVRRLMDKARPPATKAPAPASSEPQAPPPGSTAPAKESPSSAPGQAPSSATGQVPPSVPGQVPPSPSGQVLPSPPGPATPSAPTRPPPVVPGKLPPRGPGQLPPTVQGQGAATGGP